MGQSLNCVNIALIKLLLLNLFQLKLGVHNEIDIYALFLLSGLYVCMYCGSKMANLYEHDAVLSI